MHSTQLPDAFQGAMHDSLLSGSSGSLVVYGAYVDDVLWDRFRDGSPAQNLLQPSVECRAGPCLHDICNAS